MGWIITLGVLLLLGCLPLGISGIYESSGSVVNWLIGPTKIALYPRAKKAKTKSKQKNEEPSKEQTPAPKAEKTGGSFADFLPLLHIATDFLGDLRRKLRVKQLEMHLCMAGGDPCDLAINYGRAWAAVGSLMPQLERFLVIKKRDVQVSCDFTQPNTTIYFRADITITLGRLLGLLVRYGWRACKEYLKMKDKRKGGALK